MKRAPMLLGLAGLATLCLALVPSLATAAPVLADLFTPSADPVGLLTAILLAPTAAAPRALIGFPRADASNPGEIAARLMTAWETFKAEHDQKLAGKADVVVDEKVERINADLGKLQAALDAQNLKMAALAAGVGQGGKRTQADPEYDAAFRAHLRRGDVNASLNKGTAAEGGFLAPTEWDRTITDKLVIVSPMRSICQVQPTSVGAFSKLFNQRGTTSGWVGETAARPETNTPQFGSMTYSVGAIYANPYATQQMLDDALVDLETWLAGEVETEFAFQEGVAHISGSGANNRPFGLLTYVTGAANAAAHPYGAIGLVNSGAATSLTSDGLVNLVHALPTAFVQNARFGMNRNTLGAARRLKDGQGNYLWQPSFQAGQPSTLMGYPVTELAAMPDLAASSKSVAFGDFAQTYLIVDGPGVRVLRDPFSAKPYIGFYTVKRTGGGLLNPEAMKVLNTSA